MNKALIFGARMRAKATKVVELEETIEELNKRSVVELEKLDRAKNDEEVLAVEKTVDGLQREIEEKEAEKVQLEKEIDELEKQIEEQNRKAPTPGKTEKRGGKTLEQRDAIAKYIRTGQTRDIVGLKTTDSGSAALIPAEVLKPHFVNKTRNPLLDLVERVKVNSGSGKYPVIKK
ncbi:phage major capsid protein, partial [Streptococcus pneumoniae]|nr:phage major capsid protein [Streptococcus pneumoniae]